MSTLALGGGWANVQAATLQEFRRAAKTEREFKTRTFQALMWVAPRRHLTPGIWIVRRITDWVEGLLERWADELNARAVVLDDIQPSAEHHILSGQFGEPDELLQVIRRFGLINAKVIKHCSENAKTLRSIHSESRLAAAFDKLESAAKRLDLSVEYFIPFLNAARDGQLNLKTLQLLRSSFETSLNFDGDLEELDAETTARTLEALDKMKHGHQGHAASQHL